MRRSRESILFAGGRISCVISNGRTLRKDINFFFIAIFIPIKYIEINPIFKKILEQILDMLE